MSKLGDILNKDVGNLATTVLKADVADIVKGAGRALNTDVGTIAKGASKVLTYDLGGLLTENSAQPNGSADASRVENNNDGAAAAPVGAPNGPAPETTGALALAAKTQAHTQNGPAPETTGALAPTPTAASAASTPEPGSTGTFIPVETPAGSAPSTEPAKARLTEALVNRQRLTEPSGTDLLTLLPLQIGNYERAKGVAHGDIASDPVNVTYSGNGEAVTLSLVSCWDADEALEKLERNRAKLENSRGSQELNWVAGIDTRGVVFLWVRSNFCFEVVSPRGVSPVARFLGDFPY
jgi:hypothetical protein